MPNTRTHLQSKQSGVVSIMMTLVMIIVISLIVLGLAQISRREQRQSTDNQLSAQAFYAAESGVNDTVAIMKSLGSATLKSACKNDPPYDTLTPSISTNVSYSCVLVDPSPSSTTGEFGTKPTVFSLRTTGAGPGTLTFSWTPPDGVTGSTAGCPSGALSSNQDVFPTGSVTEPWNCAYAVLRVDLVDAGSLSRTNLISGTQTAFLVPNTSGALPAGAGPNLRGASCNATECSYTFSGLTGNNYYARVSGIYRSGTLRIAPGNPVQFKDVATIDVTGKAQDVLRRIKVTVNLTGGNQNGDGGAAILSGNSICKRFKVAGDGSAANDAAVTDPTCN